MFRKHQELLEDYLFHHVISLKTEENYRLCVEKLRRAIHADVDSLEFGQLLEWRRRELSEGLSPTSWNTYMRHLKALFNHGIEQGKLPYKDNYFSQLMVKAPDKLKKRLSGEQIVKIRELFEALKREEEETGNHFAGFHPVWFWRIVIETFFYTGIRRKQLLHIQMNDIDLRCLVLYVRFEGSKNKKERFLPIPDDLAPWLEKLLWENARKKFHPEDQAFNVNCYNPLSRRKEMSQCQVVACFRELSWRLGFQVSTHRFRHTLGCTLANKPTANLFLIKEILGHSSIRSTMEYMEADLAAMRAVLNERQPEIQQGLLKSTGMLDREP
ncbi:MAG: site-specific integrase [Burkholderiales bacterium]|jgi:integrase|nr:site-specific integrase [Burkholderiales bacterium]